MYDLHEKTLWMVRTRVGELAQHAEEPLDWRLLWNLACGQLFRETRRSQFRKHCIYKDYAMRLGNSEDAEKTEPVQRAKQMRLKKVAVTSQSGAFEERKVSVTVKKPDWED